MSAGEPTPSPRPLRLVLAGDVVGTIGRADFAPDAGQEVVEVPDDHWDAYVAVAGTLGSGDEMTYDRAARRFGKRRRVRTPQDEAREREATGLPARVLALEAAVVALTARLAALEALPSVVEPLAALPPRVAAIEALPTIKAGLTNGGKK